MVEGNATFGGSQRRARAQGDGLTKNTCPESVKVGTVTYRITRDPDDWLRIEHERQTKGYYGHTSHQTPVIYLNPDAAEDVTRMTLWHEVMHALCEAAMGAPDWRHLGNARDDREEAVIRKFEAPIVDVLANNPELVAYLTQPNA